MPVPKTLSPMAMLVPSATVRVVDELAAVPVVWLLARKVTLVPSTVLVFAVKAAVVTALNVTVDVSLLTAET